MILFKKSLKADTPPNDINNLKVSILGDSISTINYGGVNASNYWIGLCESNLNWTTYIDAIVGSPIADFGVVTPFSDDTRWQTLNNSFTPDLILIFGGTNDFGARDVLLGSVNDDPIINKDTFYGGMKYLLSSVLADNPTSKVIFMLPIRRGKVGEGNPSFNSDTSQYLSEFITASKYVCNLYNVDYIDLYDLSGLTNENMIPNVLYSSDGVHPNVLGHEKIFETLESELINKY